MSTVEAIPAATCTVCKKPQSELPNALKSCAKCQTQQYCSRECQKADWSRHKKECASEASTQAAITDELEGMSGSLTNPPKDEILEIANQTVALLKSFSRCSGFKQDIRSIPSSAESLMFLADFVSRTFREYIPALLPPQKFAEMVADLEPFTGIEKEDQLKDFETKFEEMKAQDSTFDKNAWPEFDRKQYSDVLQRNMVAAAMVGDSAPGGTQRVGSYDFPAEVKDVAKDIMKFTTEGEH